MTRRLLGQAQAGLGDVVADSNQREGLAGIERRWGSDHWHTRAARERLANESP